MLRLLRVSNVAIIEHVEIEFGDGLNIISGETGAGKSIFIGSLKLLLGHRFNRSMLRAGATKLSVEGLFDTPEGLPTELCDQFDIEDEILIRRHVDANGKNRVYINSSMATVADLKTLGVFLADIHGQHEHQKLLNASHHLGFIDDMLDPTILGNFRKAYHSYKEEQNTLTELINNIESIREREDIHRFYITEINELNLDPATDNNIEDHIKSLTHSEKIQTSCGNALNIIDYHETNINTLMQQATKELTQISSLAPNAHEARELLNQAAKDTSIAANLLQEILDQYNNENTSQDVDKLQSRNHKIKSLMQKHNVNSVDDLLNTAKHLATQMDNLEYDSAKIQKLEQSVAIALEKAQNKADILNQHRKKISKKICAEVTNILAELELPNATFYVDFKNKEELNKDGGINVQFFISLNKGFAPAPLAKVASGGEVSRVMLALKEVFMQSDNIGCMVFDEIDTGISGITAKKVGHKLRKISQNKQIIVITHLPVVAAQGSKHFFIEKGVQSVQPIISAEGITELSTTNIREVRGAERESVIAVMIAGDATQQAIQQARDLIPPT